jgi:hypothetical protein
MGANIMGTVESKNSLAEETLAWFEISLVGYKEKTRGEKK